MPRRASCRPCGGCTPLCGGRAMPRWPRDAGGFASITTLVAIVTTITLAAFWTLRWQPLATHLSSKAMFETYNELRRPGDQLVDHGRPGRRAASTTRPTRSPRRSPSAIRSSRRSARPNRVFAIAPQTELCTLHREIGGKPYFVIDDRNVRNLLLSNRVDGATDKNPLRTAILHAEPKPIPHAAQGPAIVCDNKHRAARLGHPQAASIAATKLRGQDLLQDPAAGRRQLEVADALRRRRCGSTAITSRSRIAARPRPGSPATTSSTRYTVTAGGGAFPPGKYDLWIGFFTGTTPNWKNMPVSASAQATCATPPIA